MRSSAAPKARAALTASWPAMASTTNRRSCGLDRALDLLHLVHHLVVDVQAARGVDDQHVVDALARRVERGARDVRRLLLARRSGRTRARPARPAAAAAGSPPGGKRRC